MTFLTDQTKLLIETAWFLNLKASVVKPQIGQCHRLKTSFVQTEFRLLIILIHDSNNYFQLKLVK